MRSAAPQRDWGIGWPHGILEGPQRAASAGGRHGDPQLRPGTKNVRRRRNGHLAVHPPVGIQRHPVRLCVGVLHLKALGEPGIETRMLQVVPAGLELRFLSLRTDLGEIDLHHGLGRSRLGPEVEVPGAGHHRVGSESAGGIRQQVTLGGLFPLGVQSRDRLLKRGAVRVRGHDRAGPRFGDVTICGIDRGRGRLQRAVPGEVPGGCRRLRRWERRQGPAGALTGGALWAGGCPRLDQHLRDKNVYYDDLISGNILRPLKLTPVSKNGFIDYMKSIGKLGGQNKVPRLSNDRVIANGLAKWMLNPATV